MSKDLLQKVIDSGIKNSLNGFFQNVSNAYVEVESNLSSYDDERFSDFQALGEIIFNHNEKLVVVTAEVVSDLTERSGKKAQYEKAKKILKEYMKYDAGIFVFYDSTGCFRFSLVYGQSEGTKKSYSNFRRFTYFVSRDQTNKTFKDRIGTCEFANLEQIKDAFSVEKVTKDFYRQIADWYFWAVQNVNFPKDVKQETNGRNNAVIRMITRLIFIWFMKERGLVSPKLFDFDNVSKLLKDTSPEGGSYYQAILQNLFFATLNTKIEDRKFRFSRSYQGRNDDYMNHGIYRYEKHFYHQEDMLEIFKDIPFLNGGLFDCLDRRIIEDGKNVEVRIDGFTDKEVGLSIPNLLFFSDEIEADLNEEYGTKNKTYKVQGLLNILSAYNFTIDENDPNDQEVALDPELLGKVFENLLASFNPETATTARKATGSYYTPREIVDYMVTQSLKQYYKTHLNDIAGIDDKLDKLVSISEEDKLSPFGETDTKRIVQLTDDLRIVDPAVGSGAFPMGILNKVVFILSKLDPDNKLWKEAQLKVVEKLTDPIFKQQARKQLEVRFSEKNSNYGRKLYLIEKCIYGVDIQQIAIEIAKLRFFIALLVDEKIDKAKPNWGIEPLPNLDFKLMQGDSLISEFMGIDFDAEDKFDTNFKFNMDEMDNLISQFRTKKGEYQNQADWDKKKALKTEIENLINRIFESKLQSQKAEYLSKLKAIENKYSTVPNIQQRIESIKKDTETLNKNYKFDLASVEKQLREFTSGFKVRPFFAWKLYFSEVFHEKNGFDIVIANPPYIRQEKIKDQKAELKKYFGCFDGTADIYVYFYERGKQILRPDGILTYISSNKYFRAGYGEKLRRYLCNTSQVCQLIDFGDAPVFEAIAYPSIIVLKNTRPQENNVVVFSWQPGLPLVEFASVVRGGSSSMPQKDLTSEGWRLESSTVQRLLEKLCKTGKPLGEYVNGRFYRGILTGLNEAFVVDRSTRDCLIVEYPSSEEVMTPFLRGKDVKRWTVNYAEQYLIKIESSENKRHSWSGKSSADAEKIFAKTYPAIHKRFEEYRQELIDRQDQGTYFWELRSCKYWQEFEQPKIAYPNICKRNEFAWDDKGYYINQKAFIIPGASKYLLGVLNSTVITWLFDKLLAKLQNGFYEPSAIFMKDFPIPVTSKPESIEALVNKILSNRSKDPEADVSDLERQIDQLVYQLYDLTPEEIAMVEEKANA